MDTEEQNNNTDSSRSNCCQPSCACSNIMQRFFERVFGGLGSTVAKFPFITIAICLVIVGVCAVGMMFLKSENRVEKLYIPPGSQSLKDLAKAKKYFPLMDTNTEQLIVVPKSGNNILTRECFLEILELHNAIISLKNFDKYCIKLDGKCVYLNPLELFDFDQKNVYNISQRITQYYNSPSYRIMRNGRPLVMNFGRMFGEAVWSKHVLQSATAVQFDYLVSSSDNDYEHILELEGSLIKKVIDLKKTFSCSEVYMNTGRSLSDATAESSGSDIVLISITFTLMITFACCAMIKFKNPLTGHALLATLGILAVGLGILAGLGLSMFAGIPFVSLVGILPFLILGVGIDDIFIIIDELDRIDVSQHTVIDNIKMVMAHSGATITMTTTTDLVAFAVSTSTQFPAIRYFCIYAALSITFAYLMVVTLFVAFMTFDVRRIKAGRRDTVVCCTVPPVKEGQPSWTTPHQQVSSNIMKAWGKALMHPAVRVVVVIFSLALLGVSIFYALKVNEDFDRRLLAKKGSYILDFLDIQEKYYPETIPVNMVVDTKVSYETKQVQDEILKLSTIATKNTYYMNRTSSWLESFQSFSHKENLSTIGVSFMPSLKVFLSVPGYAYFKQDVVLSEDNSSVVASRVMCYMESTASSVARKDGMLTLRKELAAESNISAYPITKRFIYLEQYAHTLSETTMNIGLAGAAVVIITLPFLLSLTATLLVTLGFGALICELFALMYLWDVSLNMISTINIVMAIGFSVDYSAHVAHAYLMSSWRRPEDRAIHALSTTGASVLMGGISTFLGMVVTVFASSEVFKIFFKMFVGIVVLGLIHGLCFLPVYLSLLYRWAPVKVENHGHKRQSIGISNKALQGDNNLELVTTESPIREGVKPIFTANVKSQDT